MQSGLYYIVCCSKIQHIWDYPACKVDINDHCSKYEHTDDLDVIKCLQDVGNGETSPLSNDCESLVWSFKVRWCIEGAKGCVVSQVNLTRSDRFMNMANNFCANELKRNDIRTHCGPDMHKPGYLLACLLEFQHNVSTES